MHLVRSAYIILVLLITSCGSSEHPDAEIICNCFTELHRAYDDNEINRLADSCNLLYTEVLYKYEENAEGKEDFETAFKNCR